MEEATELCLRSSGKVGKEAVLSGRPVSNCREAESWLRAFRQEVSIGENRENGSEATRSCLTDSGPTTSTSTLPLFYGQINGHGVEFYQVPLCFLH